MILNCPLYLLPTKWRDWNKLDINETVPNIVTNFNAFVQILFKRWSLSPWSIHCFKCSKNVSNKWKIVQTQLLKGVFKIIYGFASRQIITLSKVAKIWTWHVLLNKELVSNFLRSCYYHNRIFLLLKKIWMSKFGNRLNK